MKVSLSNGMKNSTYELLVIYSCYYKQQKQISGVDFVVLFQCIAKYKITNIGRLEEIQSIQKKI